MVTGNLRMFDIPKQGGFAGPLKENHKPMKTSIFILISCMIFLAACEEKGLLENSNDISYIYFSKDATKDSTSISFKFYDTDTIYAKIGVAIAGAVLKQDCEFSLSVDKEMSRLPEGKYIIPEKFTFRAGQFLDTVKIGLVNFPQLADEYIRLVLKVDETEHIKEGPVNNQRAIISVSDKVFQPEWWRVLDGGDNFYNIAEYFYVGLYSEKKMLMLLEQVDEGVELDGFNRNMLRKYALKLKKAVEDFNNDPENIAKGLVPLMDEENDEPMTIPVN